MFTRSYSSELLTYDGRDRKRISRTARPRKIEGIVCMFHIPKWLDTRDWCMRAVVSTSLTGYISQVKWLWGNIGSKSYVRVRRPMTNNDDINIRWDGSSRFGVLRWQTFIECWTCKQYVHNLPRLPTPNHDNKRPHELRATRWWVTLQLLEKICSAQSSSTKCARSHRDHCNN